MRVKDFTVDLIDVQRDGSCFFSVIALAMNESLGIWQDYDFLTRKMEKYWDEYIDLYQPLCEVTPHLIRYICSKNIDTDIFETHCIEADDRINEGELGVEKFENVCEMKERVLNGKVWGDHSIIMSFFKAFENRCSLVIFDTDFGGVVYFQKEWTAKKDMYICLKREQNHYMAMKLSFKGKKYNMCLNRKEIRHFKRAVNLAFPGRMKNEY